MRPLAAWWGAVLVAVLVQSTLLPGWMGAAWRPDFTRALVLWVALTGTPRGGAFLAVAAGALVDLASGAPPGFTALSRLALYGVTRPLQGVFFDYHPTLLIPFASLGALVDALFTSWLFLFVGRPVPAGVVWAVGWRQAVVDAMLLPILFVVLELVAGRREPGRLTP